MIVKEQQAKEYKTTALIMGGISFMSDHLAGVEDNPQLPVPACSATKANAVMPTTTNSRA